MLAEAPRLADRSAEAGAALAYLGARLTAKASALQARPGEVLAVAVDKDRTLRTTAGAVVIDPTLL